MILLAKICNVGTSFLELGDQWRIWVSVTPRVVRVVDRFRGLLSPSVSRIEHKCVSMDVAIEIHSNGPLLRKQFVGPIVLKTRSRDWALL